MIVLIRKSPCLAGVVWRISAKLAEFNGYIKEELYMKSSRLFIYILACILIALLPFLYASINICTDNESSVQQEQKLYMLSCMLNDITFSTLIHIMHDLENNLSYWHEQLKNPRSYAIIRGPQGWFGSKTAKKEIHEHIQALQVVEKIHAQVLGELHVLKHKKDLTPISYSVQSLEVLSPLTGTKYNNLNNPDYHNLQISLSNTITLMSTYKKHFDHEIYNNTKPSHFIRNWWKYIIGITAISTAGCTAYQYRKNIPQWYNKAINTLNQQWKQRIVEPIKGIKQSLSNETNDFKTKEILEKKTNLFKQEAYTYYNRRPDIHKDDVPGFVKQLIDGDNTEIMQDLNEQTRNIIKNFCNDFAQRTSNLMLKIIRKPQNKQHVRFGEDSLLLANYHELRIEKTKYEVQKMFYKITVLVAMFPAALTFYSVYKISSIAFSKLFLKKIIFQPLQERILSVRRALNRLDSGEQQQLSMEAHGHLVYLTHVLRQYISQLPTEHHENFEQDLQELVSRLTIKQKHEVVKRMYDVYGFLQPNPSS